MLISMTQHELTRYFQRPRWTSKKVRKWPMSMDAALWKFQLQKITYWRLNASSTNWSDSCWFFRTWGHVPTLQCCRDYSAPSYWKRPGGGRQWLKRRQRLLHPLPSLLAARFLRPTLSGFWGSENAFDILFIVIIFVSVSTWLNIREYSSYALYKLLFIQWNQYTFGFCIKNRFKSERQISIKTLITVTTCLSAVKIRKF